MINVQHVCACVYNCNTVNEMIGPIHVQVPLSCGFGAVSTDRGTTAVASSASIETENRRNSFLRNPEAMENVSADDGMQVTDSTSRHDTTFLI